MLVEIKDNAKNIGEDIDEGRKDNVDNIKEDNDVHIDIDNIESRITQAEIDRRLSDDKSKGIISGEQWYRDANYWYEVVISYNNPYNNRQVHSELYLLHQHRTLLSDIIKGSTLLFYGIGVGETEIEIVDWELDRANYTELVGIDVNKRFLEKFICGLHNKKKENPLYKIMFKGYHALFEQTRAEDFIFENSRYTKRAHICLGNTIGNDDDQGKIFNMLASNSQKGDLLVIGLQLDTDLEMLFRKYSTNLLFARFILNWDKKPNYSQLQWELVKDEKFGGVIHASYNGMNVFRSRKYDADKLSKFVCRMGYELKVKVIDDDKNACVQVYEKK